MITYLDTSALVKLYSIEPESLEVRERLAEAEVVATSRVAYPEARSALARARRDGRMDQETHDARVAELDADFQDLLVIEVTPMLARSAGTLADRHALRGFDAVHLASAVAFRAGANSDVKLVCFDSRLKDAGTAEGLK